MRGSSGWKVDYGTDVTALIEPLNTISSIYPVSLVIILTGKVKCIWTLLCLFCFLFVLVYDSFSFIFLFPLLPFPFLLSFCFPFLLCFLSFPLIFLFPFLSFFVLFSLIFLLPFLRFFFSPCLCFLSLDPLSLCFPFLLRFLSFPFFVSFPFCFVSLFLFHFLFLFNSFTFSDFSPTLSRPVLSCPGNAFDSYQVFICSYVTDLVSLSKI